MSHLVRIVDNQKGGIIIIIDYLTSTFIVFIKFGIHVVRVHAIEGDRICAMTIFIWMSNLINKWETKQ